MAHRAGRAAARARRGVAHGRLAADPQPRHDRRQPRARPRPPATRCRRSLVEGARDRVRVGPRHAPRAARRVRHRREAQRARAGRADHRGHADAVAAPQTFMKIGPRNAMVIAVVSLALVARATSCARRSARPRRGRCSSTAPREEADTFPERVAAAAAPIDDVRGTGGLPPPRDARDDDARAGADARA